MPVKLGELLLKESLITPRQLEDALNHQKVNGGPFGKAVVALRFATEEDIRSVLSRQYGVPSIALEQFEADPSVLKLIPAETARKYQILPVSRVEKILRLAMVDPTNVFAVDDVRFRTGCKVEPLVASEAALDEAIRRYYGPSRVPATVGERAATEGAGRSGLLDDTAGLTAEDMASIGGLSEIDLDSMGEAETDVEPVKSDDEEIDVATMSSSVDAAPITKLTLVLLMDALRRGASDIHIEPYERQFRVRFRIDGVLYNVMALPMKLREPLASRIKLMARLNLAEKRVPQDGRIRIRLRVEDRRRELALRVAVRPTVWGETIAMQLLDKSGLILDMTRLGFEPLSLERFKNAIVRPQGLVLVTGPTRSGRTQTIYAALASLNRPDVNIVTAESMVEFSLPGINQVQINKEVGESSAGVLRSLLRQDPDVVLVDEIRDGETAAAAVDAAVHGHLVLSTLHSNDAPSTVVRLVGMGVAPLQVAATVQLIQAQRLVRRICPECRVDDTARTPAKMLCDIGFTPESIGSFPVMRGEGCRSCYGSGYRGRVGIHEVMEVTGGIRDLIMAGATPIEIRRKALEEGMLTLRMSGLEKIKQGVTSIEEVLRVTDL